MKVDINDEMFVFFWLSSVEKGAGIFLKVSGPSLYRLELDNR